MWAIQYDSDKGYGVGHYQPDGTWIPFRYFNVPEEAARFLHWLNGGHADDDFEKRRKP